MELIRVCSSQEDLSSAEENILRNLLHQGSLLYNITKDGQGTTGGYYRIPSNMSISDKLEKTKEQKINYEAENVFYQQKQKINVEYETQMKNMFPNESLLFYYVVTVLCIGLVLIYCFPGRLMVLAIFLALFSSIFISPLVKSAVLRSAKSSGQYMNLKMRRDEELRKLEKNKL